MTKTQNTEVLRLRQDHESQLLSGFNIWVFPENVSITVTIGFSFGSKNVKIVVVATPPGHSNSLLGFLLIPSFQGRHGHRHRVL